MHKYSDVCFFMLAARSGTHIQRFQLW